MIDDVAVNDVAAVVADVDADVDGVVYDVDDDEDIDYGSAYDFVGVKL